MVYYRQLSNRRRSCNPHQIMLFYVYYLLEIEYDIMLMCYTFGPEYIQEMD